MAVISSTARVFLVVLSSFIALILTIEVKTVGFYGFDNTQENQQVAAQQSAFRASLDAIERETQPNTLERDEKALLHSLSLIRQRPTGLRLAFVGDSVTRYQFLSLAFFLRWGRWFDPQVYPNHLVDAHSFHHPQHPDNDWNEFFLQSNRLLAPNEACDCQRSRDSRHWAVERRYFYDPSRNNTLT